MKADLTRSRFTPTDHNRRLLFQQARVTLDAELNEQIDIDLHRDTVTTLDVVGPVGAPVGDAGFGLTPTATLLAVARAGATVVAVGQAATILTRSGTTWSTVSPPAGVTATLRAASGNSGGDWVAVGDGGTVLHSSGGTVSKVALPAAVTGDLLGVWMDDTGHACAVGAGGVILTSPDAVTWTEHAQIAGVTGALRSVSFADAQHGWAVGDAATILATSDGGVTWTLASTPAGIESTLRAVCALGPEAAAAFGDATTAMAIAAGGDWVSLGMPAGVAARLTGVAVTGGQLLVCGERGTLLRAQVTATQPGAFNALAGGGDADLRGLAATGSGASAVGAFAAWLDIDGAGNVTVVTLPVPGIDLAIGAGRIYVDGILVENDAPAALSDQPDLPAAPAPAAGTYAAYLDIWERHLTAVERDELREVALGGPDTSTRARTIWQVRLDAAPAGATCALYPPGWGPGGGSSGWLRARANPAPVTGNDCMVPQNGGYRRLENQLYRVEIHAGGTAGTATFVWSRDNGSMLSRVLDTDPTLATVTVAQPGRDDVIGFASATVIELSDEEHVLSAQPGELLNVAHVDGDVITTTGAAVPALSALGDVPTARRWDGTGTVEAGSWIELEDGVQIQFADGNYRTGDWWTIPARTLTATVDWPQEDAESLFVPAAGIQHHYAALGMVTIDAEGRFAVTGDCRPLFPPLTEATRFFGVGGDGQELVEGGPDKLPAPLEVGVMRGTEPVTGAAVSFTVTDGGGSVDQVVAVTDGEGIAAVSWTLGPSGPQRVEARLLDSAGAPTDATPIHFNAMRLAPGTGTCTVSARPGDNLQLAAKQLLAAGGGELCLAAGHYPLKEPVTFFGQGAGKSAEALSVTVSGRGDATVLDALQSPCALVFTNLESVLVRCLSGVSGAGALQGEKLLSKLKGQSPGNPVAVLGTLTSAACANVTVVDVALSCADGDKPDRACISVYAPPVAQAGGKVGQATAGGGLWTERCRLRVGAQQYGVEVVGAARATIARNHVTLLDALTPWRPGGSFVETAKLIAAEMMGARVTEQSVDTEQIELPRAKEVVNIPSDSPSAAIWRMYAASPKGRQARTVGGGAADYVSAAIEQVAQRTAPASLTEAINAAFLAVRVAGVGIDAVGLTGAETAQVIDNVVEGCAVAVRVRRGGGRGRVVHAIVARNILAPLAPPTTANALGISAGDVVNLEAVSNQMTLVRPIKWAELPMGTTTGVLVSGILGPYQVVRDTSLDLFTSGVVFEPASNSAGPASARLWLVTETVAANTGAATPLTPDMPPIVVAPDSVIKERNFGS
jgi:hypothetical protein